METLSTCFACSRLNETTFLIVEDDKLGEYPFIYAKVYTSVLVLIDTGCGGASRDVSAKVTCLRAFLETYPIVDNDNQPLNPGSEKNYVVICTHCHFDHIGAIAQFTDTAKSAIWASSYDKPFVNEENRLPTNSLCRFFDIETPKYEVTHWADDGQHVFAGESGEDLGLVIYHTPGHTPDELAVWDPQERVIFVGDTMYEWVHIAFPLEGDLRLYSNTLGKLRSLVEAWNSGRNRQNTIASIPLHPIQSPVKIACGHITSTSDAQQLINNVDMFLYQVTENMVDSKDQGEFRDEQLISYDREDGRISFMGPKRLFDEFRKDSDAVHAIRNRQEVFNG